MTTEKEKELRLACLELAMNKCTYISSFSNIDDEILNTANKFYNFIQNNELPTICACDNVISK